jgi:hypothetical protein
MDLTHILVELERMAFSDIREVLDTDGNPKALEEIDPHTRAAIGSYRVSAHGFAIAFGGKDQARELLLRHLVGEASDVRRLAPQKSELPTEESEIDAQLAAMARAAANRAGEGVNDAQPKS